MQTKPIPPKRRKGDGSSNHDVATNGVPERALSPTDVMKLLDITRSKFDALVLNGDLGIIRVRGVIRVPMPALRKAFPSLFS